MSRIRYIAYGLLALLFANVAAAAITLSPVPGSAFQTAHPMANFPNPIGVVAKDDSGAPVPGLQVAFEPPFGVAYVVNIGNYIVATTDAQGVAMIPYPGLTASNQLGTFAWLAVAPGATSALFNITVAGTEAANATIVSGDNQTVLPGATFPQPFVGKVTDSDGAPIPYAVVFTGGQAQSVPSGFFQGQTEVVLVADAAGVFTSPLFTANSVLGSSTVFAQALSDLTVFANFHFTIAVPPPPITLSAVAGSTPQSTCRYCFFPVPVGVAARYPDGSPASGVTVTFGNDPSFVQVPGHEGTVSFDVVTGADGIATASSQTSPAGYIAYAAGSTTVTASSAAATNSVTFNLSASGNPQNRIELLSGGSQSAPAGGEFAPLIVRASDDNGPVANAVVQFISSGGAASPTVAFNGASLAYVKADAQGIAISPLPVANAVAGAPLVNASLKADPPAPGFGGWVPGVSFGLLNTTVNPNGVLRPWQVPPLSIAVNSTTALPFAMQVLDASGNPVANAPVTFTTDSNCATFNGSRTVTATSDANGIATSPPLKGTRASVACATSAHVQGQSRDLTMHVFDPAKVQATISPNYIVMHYLTEVSGISLAFSEHNRPVHVAQVSVTPLPVLGVSYAGTPVIDIFDSSIFIGITPSQKKGAYAVQVTTIGGQHFIVPVVQVP